MKLVRVEGFPYDMRYVTLGFPGSPPEPWVAEALLQPLEHVREFLGPEYELALLDCYRPPVAQQHLYDVTLAEFHAAGMSEEEALENIKGFVANPSGVYPHGTGGAIDVTLYRDGKEVWMGTEFDEFNVASARDWYRENPPTEPGFVQASRDRELLRAAMESAGFVGLDTEWWHFEYGTARWGRVLGRDPLLTSVLELA